MVIIYMCYGSAHSSVVAASIHIGLLPTDRVPSFREIISLPHYDKTSNEEIGTLFYMGKDEFGNEVYIVGARNGRDVVTKAIYSFLNLYGISEKEVLVVDALPAIGITTKIGGIASRRLGIISLGRPITVYGILKRYKNFVELVTAIKTKLQKIS
ncbi:DUF3189 family protein [Caldanaerobacter subterraneus]|uniref:DUF3189 family protein n=1 Tax=Caldanaerobacter subterraneus TaxID=911092 RepID=A0A7Y2PJP2_9THEO|nr:DUF3189 family protein [Caldanaerobacter subterraneus]NNG66084.1 DUF3189 family protein [Caldanaerobacter subterraneus]